MAEVLSIQWAIESTASCQGLGASGLWYPALSATPLQAASVIILFVVKLSP